MVVMMLMLMLMMLMLMLVLWVLFEQRILIVHHVAARQSLSNLSVRNNFSLVVDLNE